MSYLVRKVIRFYAIIFILGGLFFAFSVKANEDLNEQKPFNILFTKASETQIEGYSLDLDVKFSAVSANNLDSIILLIGENKSIYLTRNHENTNFYIAGKLINTDTNLVMQKEEQAIIHSLKKNLEQYRGYTELGDTFLNALTILETWSEGMPLTLDINNATVQVGGSTISREDFDIFNTPANGKATDVRRAIGQSICSSVGRDRRASFFDTMGWHNSDEFVGTKGPFLCNGRCGNNCGGVGIQPGLENNYTQDCFNHDVCSIYYSPTACAFTAAATIDDTFFNSANQGKCTLSKINSVTPSLGNAGDLVKITIVPSTTEVKSVSFGVANNLEVAAKIIARTQDTITVQVPSGKGRVSIFVDSNTNGRAEKMDAFTYKGTQSNIIRIISQNSNKCMQIGGFGGSNWNPVVQQSCGSNKPGHVYRAPYSNNPLLGSQFAANPNDIDSPERERWNLYDAGNGFFYIANRYSGRCLDVPRGSGRNGEGVEQWTCKQENKGEQQWRFQALGNGYYYIINKASGKCLDVPRANTANGIELNQWTCEGAIEQKWKVEYLK